MGKTDRKLILKTLLMTIAVLALIAVWAPTQESFAADDYPLKLELTDSHGNILDYDEYKTYNIYSGQKYYFRPVFTGDNEGAEIKVRAELSNFQDEPTPLSDGVQYSEEDNMVTVDGTPVCQKALDGQFLEVLITAEVYYGEQEHPTYDASFALYPQKDIAVGLENILPSEMLRGEGIAWDQNSVIGEYTECNASFPDGKTRSCKLKNIIIEEQCPQKVGNAVVRIKKRDGGFILEAKGYGQATVTLICEDANDRNWTVEIEHRISVLPEVYYAYLESVDDKHQAVPGEIIPFKADVYRGTENGTAKAEGIEREWVLDGDEDGIADKFLEVLDSAEDNPKIRVKTKQQILESFPEVETENFDNILCTRDFQITLIVKRDGKMVGKATTWLSVRPSYYELYTSSKSFELHEKKGMSTLI